MQYRKIMSMLLILVLVAPWLAPAGKVSAGASYPVPGNNGLITVKGVDDNSVEVKWEYAQSDNTASHELSYRVFFSQNSDLTDANEINNSSVDHAYGNWISGSESTDGSFSRIVTNLTEGETYYFNVIVQDRYSDFAYQMQSIKFTTPLGEFNNAIGQNFDAAKIAELFKNENFITTTPDFESLPLEEQNALVTLAGQMNEPVNGYQSNLEVQLLVDYIQQGISVMKANELSDVQERLSIYYDRSFTFAASVSPEYLNMIKPMLDQYFDASDLERNVLAFKIKLQRITSNPSLEESVMNLSMAPFQITKITNASTQSEMIKALKELYNLQQQAEEFKGTDKETLVGTFPLDFSKMQSVSSDMTEMEKLADWMLLKKPGNGYETYSTAQKYFDQFFDTPAKESLTQLNEAILAKDRDAILSLLRNSDLLTQPGSFGDLTEEEQNTVAATLVQLIPDSNSYNGDQVQFIVDASAKALKAYRLDYREMAYELQTFYQQILLEGPGLFSQKDFGLFKAAADFYLKANEADQRMIAYIAKMSSVTMNNDSDVSLLFMISGELPSINQASSANEAWQHLTFYYMMQVQTEMYMNQYPEVMLQEFPLQLNRLNDISEDMEQQQKLAEWMFSERPIGGYEKINDIQRAFNLFFAPPAPNVSADDTANVVIGADETMEYSKDHGVTWNKFTSTDRFEGNQTIVVRVRAKGNTPVWKWTTLTFTSNTPTPNPGGSTGGGSSTTTPVTSTPAPTTKQEQIVVDVNGANGTNLTKTPITRTTETNGIIKDLVKMTEAIAKESVEKAKQLNMNTARIVIPDTKDSVSETRIELPKAAVKELNDGSLKLEISTENAVISVPTNSIAGFDQDLYFRVVPLKKESERKEVEERAKKEQLIQQIAPNANVRVLARPVEIETNMQSREVTLTLPLRDSLPTDPVARQQALDNLAIYIEHSDGTKELIQGKLVQLVDNSEGIEFTVTKFSTFTLVVVDGLKVSQSKHQPYIQGFGADFRPDAFVTRAQMAAMLARNLPTEAAAGSANSVSYKDVSATHWATSEIQKAQSAGIMNGMSNTQFAPEGSITRAQMAAIAYRWMQQQASATTVNGPAVSFTDVSTDLWAADAIAYVQSAGLMVGYNDGTFKPNAELTRAEAVKVLNVLFNRTPLTGAATPTFSDVPATHWAYADIEAAAQK
ncbi:S-layer homology domain-containing protein [Paenibacillus sp. CF095]|uniref:S-layer homology domain-containing protein n=1 Tax=Paenibacillus sp. CF095 TaxID=1881033 RepID=UPI000880BD9F|nr:S-layer homology domain-containing protein [Paenibacillus sp. CF095]SDD29723.1 S-layer homology domain-containing protein [Paenibacillus sp. CF095]